MQDLISSFSNSLKQKKELEIAKTELNNEKETVKLRDKELCIRLENRLKLMILWKSEYETKKLKTPL